MNRSTKTLSASENLRVALNRGNAVLVQVKTDAFTGTIDFKTAIDGVNWTNHPYIQPRAVSLARSVSQLAPSAETATTLYLLLPPVTDARIDVVVTSGTVDITFREILHAGFP